MSTRRERKAFTVIFYGSETFRCKTVQLSEALCESICLGPTSENRLRNIAKTHAKALSQITNQLLYQLSYAGILRAETPPSAAISVLTVYAIFHGMPVGAMSTGQRAKRN
jgi:hypothetical protein